MMSKKILLVSLATVMSILLFSACEVNSLPSDPIISEEVTAEEATVEKIEEIIVTEEAEEEPVEEEPVEEEPLEKPTLVIESWRNDDLQVWQNVIIPAFNVRYPDIEVIYASTEATEYDDALNSRLESGTAGDIITCRPFDRSLALFHNGHLLSLNELEGIANFDPVATSAWVTDDGSDIFCVPMASVIHGFIYNVELFDQVGVAVPETVEEFFVALETFKAAGIVPLAMGTADQWDIATMGFQNIGPNYWKGESGRVSLIIGNAKFTDPEYIATFEQLARWEAYMPDDFVNQTYPESRDMFIQGEAAIYPAGSWDISHLNNQVDFAMSAFKPPVQNAGDKCYISDHTDIGIGMNANTDHPEAAIVFLNWIASSEFANLFSNAEPGFYSLRNSESQIQDPLASTFASWRQECESTIRNSYQILSRGEPSLESELWRVSVEVVNGDITPEEGAAQLQDGLESWYYK